MKKILITGGAGFIGTETTKLALSQGWKVVVLDNLSLSKRPDPQSSLEFIQGDVRDLELVNRIVADVDGGIIHLAADSRVLPSIQNTVAAAESVETNVIGTLNILRSIIENNLKLPLVYAASSTAYGNMPSPQKENMLPHTQTPYAAGKLSGEFLIKSFCETFDISATCLRYFQVYGEGQPSTGSYALVTGIFERLYKENMPLTIEGSGLQSRDFVHVHDIARANLLALENQLRGDVINIGTGFSTTILQLANMFGSEIKFLPQRRIDLQSTCADTNKAKEVLGFETNQKLEDWVNMVKNS